MKDPEKHWRRYAPPGTEEEFARYRAHYQKQSKFNVQFGNEVTDKIIEEILREQREQFEQMIDRHVRIALRMRRARRAANIIRILDQLETAVYRQRVDALTRYMIAHRHAHNQARAHSKWLNRKRIQWGLGLTENFRDL